MPKRDGFPEPLFEDIAELDEIIEAEGFLIKDAVVYLLFGDVNIGALRAADPVLGDLTVMAKEAIHGVSVRVAELYERTAVDRFVAGTVVGAVPEDQA